MVLAFALGHAFAAISIPTASPTTQNFDGIGTSATATLPADFKVDRPGTVRTVGNYATAGTATTQVGGASLSSSASNGIYNFGSGTTTTGSDRAIGFLASSGGTTSGNLYAQLMNNTGGGLSSLNLSYDVEKYRNGSNGAGFRIQLFYSTDGATWTSAGNNFLTSFAADANNNGFSPAPGATVNVTAPLNVAIPNNGTFYLAWNYSVSSGSTVTNAQALAIDNISIRGVPAVAQNNPPTITAPANPYTTVAQDSAPFNVSLSGSDDGGVYNWSANAGAGVSNVSVTGGQGTSNVTYTVALQNGYSGTASFTALLSDNVNAPVSQAVNINVTAAPPNHVVISQIYGGGGNTNAPYTNDYVELFNPTGTTFTLTGWTLQYGSATGTTWTNNQPLGGTIAPGEYYLVELASGGNVGQPLPVQPNIVGSINMSATAGKVALVNNGSPLSGGCPVGSDSRIVDFVGYGSTANCREGSANAPAPSNTTALFRLNNGNSDTNQNGNDFTTGAPSPRRTSPIVELGPWVASTDPTTNDTVIPHDASITVNFSEPVDVDANWYNINCNGTGGSGLHNDATVAHTSDSKTYVITPNVNFNFGEQCTVTISQTAVHDQDTDDSAPGTDTLPADYTWSFTVVGAGDPAPYPPSVHLTMGNPSNAVADITQENNYLMMKPTYALSYNRGKGTPNWVSWHLTSEWYGTLARVDTFRPDPAVPADWYRVQATDYFTTGFDRGHMTPNADRDNQNRVPINQETYLMSNMVPQAPDNNQGPWANFENYLRSLTDAGSELYIVSGPLGVGGTGSNGGVTTTIASGHVTVPAYTWKVVLVLQKQDGDDVARVNAATRTIAVLMPNTQGIRSSPNNPNDWQNYLTTVDAVENLTGYDFFSNVPVAIQNSIEAGTNGTNPPGTANGFVTTDEDTPATFTLDAVSPNNSPLTTTIVNQPTNGTVSCDGPNGTNCTYTPAANFNGTDSFTFKVSNGSATSNTSTETITVNPVNDAPVAVADSATTDEDTPVQVSVLANDSDVDGDTLSVTAVTQGAHGSVVNNGDGTATYTPAHDYNGADTFTYTVSDGHGGTATANVSVTINPVNDPPAAAADSATTDEDTPVKINVLANDGDVDGDTLSVSAVTQGSHGSVTINGDGTVSYSPNPNYNGSDSFTYTVSDGHGGTSTAAVSVTVNPVNDAPSAAAQSVATDEDHPTAITLSGGDVETAAANLTYAVTSGPLHGTLSGAAPNLTYTPNANYNGGDSFKFTVTDTGDGPSAALTSSEAVVSITVNAVNDAPTADAQALTTDEDTPKAITLSGGDVETPAGGLIFTVTTPPAHGTLAGTAPNLTYTPAADYNGTDSFQFTVTDTGDGNSPAATSAPATVSLTINPVNDAPVASDASATTDEDNSVAVQLAASDVDGDALTFSVAGGPAHGSVSISGHTATYTPAHDYNGADAFTFKANDGRADSNAATVSVQVNPVNDAPVAVADSAATDEDTPTTFSVLANDTDVDGDTLSVSAVTQGAHGSVTINGDGTVTYAPAHDYNGADAFTYTVSDGHGGTATGNVSVQVRPVNDAPVPSGVPASATIPELSLYTFNASASDVDGDALTFSLVGAPAGASINPTTGLFTWTPTEAQGGTGSPYSFKVRVSDGTVNVDSDVTINVTEVNQQPVLAHIGDQLVLLGGTLAFTASATDADLPAQHLSYSLNGFVPAGASINASTGQFTWTPAPAQTGQVYTFNVRATDDGPGSLFAEETIHVGVGYTWTGFLPPVNADGSSVFKLGRTVPVKFALTGPSAGITNAVARLYVAKFTDNVLGTEEQAESTASATAGNLFRYADGQYVFNLSTDGLTAGTYQLRVDMGDGVARVVNISLR